MTDSNYLHAEEFNGVSVIRVKNADYFDRFAIQGLRDDLVAFVQANTPDKLIIDFVNVKAISSETINALLRAREFLVASDGQLKLCGMSKTIRQAFIVTNLDGTVFDICESIPDAFRALSAPA